MADLHITEKRVRYTYEELEIIKDNYPHNLDLIVELLPNRNRKGIIVKAYYMGLASGKNKPWSKEEDDIIKKYYPSNGSMYISSNLLKNRDYKSIQQRANKLNVSFITYNKNYFDKIDSHEKAYWIGFFMADGYVNNNDNRFGMELQIGDIKHIEKFLSCIEGNQKIRTRIRHPKEDGSSLIKNKTESCSILINNKNMHDGLIKAGVLPNKSFTLRLLKDKATDKYFFDILRGLIDGDGTIGLYKTGNGYLKPNISLVSASKNLLIDIQTILKSKGVDISVTERESEGKKIYMLRTEKQETCFYLLKNLYSNSTENSKLDRKYLKALEITNYYKKYGFV